MSPWLQELDFWGLTELDIEPCCWGHYCKFKENKETLTALDDNFTFHLEEDGVNNPPSSFTHFKRNMWIFLEDPSSSRSSKVRGSSGSSGSSGSGHGVRSRGKSVTR